MQEDRGYSAYPSNLDVWAAFNELNNYLKENKYISKPQRTDNFPEFKIEVSSRNRFYADNFDEFLKVLSKYQKSLPLKINTTWDKGKEIHFGAIIEVMKSGLSVAIHSNNLDIISAIHEKIRVCFHAYNPQREQSERLSRYNLKKTIFLAHRFDETGNSTAAIIKRFLRRLGFEVKEGSGYESRDIQDKVRERIESQDIFICLVTPGDASWLLTEATTAKTLDKYLIIILQEKTDFKKAIIGEDFEHLSFPEGQIEKCFSDLLFALPLN